MSSSIVFVALISVSAFGQTIPPLVPYPYVDKVLGGTTAGVGSSSHPNKTPKEKVNQNLPNGTIGGRTAETKMNPPRRKEMVLTTMIASGMLDAFMHKQHLLPGEKTCLEDSVAQFTGDLVGTGRDVIDAFKSLTSGTAAGKRGAASQDNAAVSGVDAGLRMVYFVSSVAALLKNCVQGDALGKLNEAAHHLVDLKHLGHRIVANGVDIAESLADSIVSYEDQHYYQFGDDIGTILRKILLSNATDGARVPEGVPETKVIEQTSEGLLDGFFVGGSSMVVTDSAHPDVDIRLDLHQCIVGNEAFFKEIFLSIWSAIGQFSANEGQHGLPDQFSAAASPRWAEELMLALTQLPSALERCNIDTETQEMLMESIRTLGQVHVHVDFQQGKSSIDEVSKTLVQAIKYWKKFDYKKFGNELGVMLRELVLMLYPMKYSVDQSGRLRRQWSWTHTFKRMTPGMSPGFLISVVLGVSFTAFMGLLVVRRTLSTSHAPSKGFLDVELASDDLSDEHIE